MIVCRECRGLLGGRGKEKEEKEKEEVSKGAKIRACFMLFSVPERNVNRRRESTENYETLVTENTGLSDSH